MFWTDVERHSAILSKTTSGVVGLSPGFGTGIFGEVDQFPNRLLQAFATASSGMVHFFTKEENGGTNMPTTLAW
jgi:hypothetical protein